MQYHQSESEREEEKQWVILLKHGDADAFGKLYKIYGVRLLGKLIRMLKDEELAKEVLQEVFLKIWEKRETLDPEKSFRSYLFRITENKIVDVFRKVSVDRKLSAKLCAAASLLYQPVDDQWNFKETNNLLQHAIDALPPQRKKIFVLCKLEDKTYEEVAALMQISVGTVNDHIVKASRSLKNYLNAVDLVVASIILASLSLV